MRRPHTGRSDSRGTHSNPVNAETMERGLDIYLMLAAVAVGALDVGFNRKRQVWRTVRKLRRSFQEICLNPNRRSLDEPCRQLDHRGDVRFAAGGLAEFAWRRGFSTPTVPKFWAAGGASTPLPRPAGNWTTLRKGFPLLLAHGARSLSARRPRTAGRTPPARMTSQRITTKALSQLENLRRPSTNSSRAAWSPRRKNSAAAT